MDELLTISRKELARLEVMKRAEERRLRQRTAAEILGVSPRHMRWLLRFYRVHEEAGSISKRRGKPSSKRPKSSARQ